MALDEVDRPREPLRRLDLEVVARQQEAREPQEPVVGGPEQHARRLPLRGRGGLAAAAVRRRCGLGRPLGPCRPREPLPACDAGALAFTCRELDDVVRAAAGRRIATA